MDLSQLSIQHKTALEWFLKNSGTVQPWPQPLGDGTHLATKAKGIYKPAWLDYALSIRQTLNSPYPNREIITLPNGTWCYSYFQENDDPKKRDDAYTNRGLISCWKDGVPVGVLHQISGKPNVKYKILGLAYITGWEDGYFFLEGTNDIDAKYEATPKAQLQILTASVENSYNLQKAFDISSIKDGREKVLASIVRRRGQAAFRKMMLSVYGGQCAISGCKIIELLEAAHILPYLGPDTNHIKNGLLLRADIHTLFDLGLLAVNTENMSVVISKEITDTLYQSLAGVRVLLPIEVDSYPSLEALNQHRAWCGF